MLLKVILISIIYLVHLQNAAAYDVPGGSLKPGMFAVIKGYVWADGDNIKIFSVNYIEANGDIAFHMSLRYDISNPRHSKVVLNSLIGDEWQTEEIQWGIPGGDGFYKDHFLIEILTTEDHFEFWINDRKYRDFKYRTDIEKITSVEIYKLDKDSLEWK